MKSEINKFKLKQKNEHEFMTKKNRLAYQRMKLDLERERERYFDDLKENRIKGFQRAYVSVKDKLTEQRERGLYETPLKMRKSTKKLNGSETSNNRSVYEPNITVLPKVKLEMNDVYSRLYNNAVFPTDHKNNRYAKVSRARSVSKNEEAKLKQNNKIKFTLKSTLGSTGGKEFTVKITPEAITVVSANIQEDLISSSILSGFWSQKTALQAQKKDISKEDTEGQRQAWSLQERHHHSWHYRG